MNGVIIAFLTTFTCATCGSDMLLPATVPPELSPTTTFSGLAEMETVSVLVAGQKTIAARTTDTVETARQERLGTVGRLVRLREKEDINFVIKTRNLARRMQREPEHFAISPIRAHPTTGSEFLEALILASQRGPIANLIIFGHAAPTALYMIEDRGFYASVGDVAKATSLVSGTEAEKEEKLRALGARDLADLELLIKNGDVKFAENAVIIFAGCGVAGATEIEAGAIASRITTITGATTIASIGVTDQSMSRAHGNVPSKEYSRGTWVRFVNVAKPQKLHTRVLDPLEHLKRDGVLPSTLSTAGSLDLMRKAPALPRFRCASHVSDAKNIPTCGASYRGNAIAQIRESSHRIS
jgi:hypothetical protein